MVTPRTGRGPDKWIEDITGALFDPIIVMPGGWGDTLPENIRKEIPLHRLIANMEALKTGKMTATDVEAMAYLYTASLVAPMLHDWTQIYLYVATKFLDRHQPRDAGPSAIDEIRVDRLTESQERELARFKDWIYQARVKARKERGHEERLEAQKGGTEEAKQPFRREGENRRAPGQERNDPGFVQASFNLWGEP